MSSRIHHAGVTVADLERAVRFYTEGLGFEVAVRQTSAAGYLAHETGCRQVNLLHLSSLRSR